MIDRHDRGDRIDVLLRAYRAVMAAARVVRGQSGMLVDPAVASLPQQVHGPLDKLLDTRIASSLERSVSHAKEAIDDVESARSKEADAATRDLLAVASDLAGLVEEGLGQVDQPTIDAVTDRARDMVREVEDRAIDMLLADATDIDPVDRSRVVAVRALIDQVGTRAHLERTVQESAAWEDGLAGHTKRLTAWEEGLAGHEERLTAWEEGLAGREERLDGWERSLDEAGSTPRGPHVGLAATILAVMLSFVLWSANFLHPVADVIDPAWTGIGRFAGLPAAFPVATVGEVGEAPPWVARTGVSRVVASGDDGGIVDVAACMSDGRLAVTPALYVATDADIRIPADAPAGSGHGNLMLLTWGEPADVAWTQQVKSDGDIGLWLVAPTTPPGAPHAGWPDGQVAIAPRGLLGLERPGTLWYGPAGRDDEADAWTVGGTEVAGLAWVVGGHLVGLRWDRLWDDGDDCGTLNGMSDSDSV